MLEYRSMETDTLLLILEKQEEELRFETLSYSLLHDIGETIIRKAKEKDAAVYVMIRLSGSVIYASAMDGSSANNIKWAIRKANTAELNGRSSMRDGMINRAKGRTLAERGLNEAEYTDAGGSFPIMLASGVTIGSITVSGMASEEDHQLIADVLAEFLEKRIQRVV